MSSIRILSDILANQVAAGEVIERPASVVKELVENSLDAGATRIQVDFSRGGAGWIRVSDNGSGMGREDALLSLERHGTSKIRNAEDLSAIGSFGFRGEAIPSIASVSRFRLATRMRDAPSGVEIVIDGGRIQSVKECGESSGTTVDVRSLFFNVPARRKFLKAESTESAHVVHWLETIALAHPGVAFQLRRDSTPQLQAAAVETLGERIRSVLGAEAFRRMREIPELETGGIRIQGYVGQAGEGRGDRYGQFLYVNRRPVREAVLRRALEEAYHRLLPGGRHPVAVIFLDMDPAQVDCNVHPAKREVRFRNPGAIRDAVGAAIRAALVQASPSRSVPAPTSPPAPPARPFLPAEPGELVEIQAPAEVSPEPHATESPDFSYRGRLGIRYALLESAGGLVILDIRAASQRLWYEELLGELRGGGVRSQRLLLPAVVELSARDHEWVTCHRDLLERAGIGVEGFGPLSVKVDSLPSLISDREPADVLMQTLPSLRDAGQGAERRILEDAIAKSVSHLAAPPAAAAGEQEIRRLLAALFQCELPYACPMGRPTLIEMGISEIDRKFGRQ